MNVWQFIFAGYLLAGVAVHFFILVRTGDWWKKPISTHKYWWRYLVAFIAFKPPILVVIQILLWPILLALFLLTQPDSD
jgi:hypothetical protein